MVSQEIIRETITRYFAANEALDVEGFVNVFAADATIYNAGEIPLSGLETIRQVAVQTLTPFQETRITLEKIFIMGNGAAVFYTGSLTTKDGRSVNAEGIDVFEINDEGKIQTLRFYFDPAPMIALFGA